jgi:phosphoesterase RecJ-like protein
MKIPPKLRDIVKENNKFLIVSHINPEADAIGSCIGLALGLRKLGKHTRILSRDPIPGTLQFLPRADLVSTKIPSAAFDVLFLIDCNDPQRTGLPGLQAQATVIIDHHIPTPNITRHTFNSRQLIKLIDKDASAAGELVYRVLHYLDITIDRPIATNLYTSIYSDTGGFRYSNTGQATLKIAASLIEAGASPWEITKEIYESVPEKTLRLLALTLTTMERNGAIASLTINRHMFNKTKTSAEDTENFVDYPRKIKGVEVAVLFREEARNVYKLSMRSKGTVNVAEIARTFGGGGHANAAGCRLSGTLPEVKKKAFGAIRKAMKKI